MIASNSGDEQNSKSEYQTSNIAASAAFNNSSFLIPTSLFKYDPFLLPYFLALLPPKLRSQWARSDSDATCR